MRLKVMLIASEKLATDAVQFATIGLYQSRRGEDVQHAATGIEGPRAGDCWPLHNIAQQTRE
jgi:hypothetical protein